MRLGREFYRPKDARVEYPDGLPEGYEIHRYESEAGACYAAVFGGKRSKPDWHYRFNNEDHREESIAKWIEGQKAHLEYQAERRKERNGGHSLKVGDALHASWGYDQTNADFWQVVEVPSKCFVVCRKIASKMVEGEAATWTQVVPVKDAFLEGERGAPKRYKAGPNNSIAVYSFAKAHKTDWETSHYETGYACGH